MEIYPLIRNFSMYGFPTAIVRIYIESSHLKMVNLLLAFPGSTAGHGPSFISSGRGSANARPRAGFLISGGDHSWIPWEKLLTHGSIHLVDGTNTNPAFQHLEVKECRLNNLVKWGSIQMNLKY